MAFWQLPGTQDVWKVLGPVAITLVLTMTANYFVFLQHMVRQEKYERDWAGLQSQLSAMQQTMLHIKSRQDERTNLVLDIPGLRQQVAALAAESAERRVLQGQIDGLRRNVADLRKFLYSTIGREPPGVEPPQ